MLPPRGQSLKPTTTSVGASVEAILTDAQPKVPVPLCPPWCALMALCAPPAFPCAPLRPFRFLPAPHQASAAYVGAQEAAMVAYEAASLYVGQAPYIPLSLYVGQAPHSHPAPFLHLPCKPSLHAPCTLPVPSLHPLCTLPYTLPVSSLPPCTLPSSSLPLSAPPCTLLAPSLHPPCTLLVPSLPLLAPSLHPSCPPRPRPRLPPWWRPSML